MVRVAVSRDSRCGARARAGPWRFVEGAGFISAGSRGGDALRPPGSRLAVNALQGREDNEMDSHKPVGETRVPGEVAGRGGFVFFAAESAPPAPS